MNDYERLRRRLGRTPAVAERQAGSCGVTLRNLQQKVGGCSLPLVKALLIGMTLLFSTTAALADAPKNAPVPKKLPREERVYVMDKDAPSADKTVPLMQPRVVVSKNK